MNAATACRLKKEARALFPFWAAIAVWMILPFALSAEQPLPYFLIAFVFGCTVLGPVCVGNEFSQGTMSFLLAQPVPRRKLWREKFLVTGMALLGLTLLLVALIQATHQWEHLLPYDTKNDPWHVVLFLALTVLVPVMGFCTGPAWALVARNALGGGALTFICPQILLVLGIIILHYTGISNREDEGEILISYALVVGSVYSAGMFWFGRRQFAGLEDVAPIRRDVALPDSWSRPFAGLAAHLLPKKRGITTSLILKELRLQQPAFAMAAVLVAVWLAFVVVWLVRPTLGSGLMVVPSMLLCFGIPILLGSQSTAEERSLGIHDWHLTLPVTARRQWFVKVFIAFSLNMVLGLLLPWLLALGTESLTKDRDEFLYGTGTKVLSVFINFILLSTTLHASTMARNTSRALLGTIVLCTAGTMILSRSGVLESWLWQWPDQRRGQLPDEVWESVFRFRLFYWVMICTCLAGWFYALGLPNFRHSLGSLRLPIQRLSLFFAVAWLLVNIGSAVWEIRFLFLNTFGW